MSPRAHRTTRATRCNMLTRALTMHHRFDVQFSSIHLQMSRAYLIRYDVRPQVALRCKET